METSISVLVADTNIWIDLHHGGILREFFRLPYRIVAPDLVKDRELLLPGWQTVESIGLEFIALGPSLVVELYALTQIHRGVSLGDLSALVLVNLPGASKRKFFILFRELVRAIYPGEIPRKKP